MAGEGRKATVKYIVDDGGLQFAVIGTADTVEHARAEADAKLAITVGDSVVRGTETAPIAQGTLDALTLAAGADGDLTLEMQCREGDADSNPNFGKFATLRMRGVTTTLLIPGSSEIVEVGDILVEDLAGAYMDGDGHQGYVPITGRMKP